MPHTVYSTAKFAVKGFSEALIEDLRTNAPHVRVAVVMPGHVGTNIVGKDATGLDAFIRANPDATYDYAELAKHFQAAAG